MWTRAWFMDKELGDTDSGLLNTEWLTWFFIPTRGERLCEWGQRPVPTLLVETFVIDGEVAEGKIHSLLAGVCQTWVLIVWFFFVLFFSGLMFRTETGLYPRERIWIEDIHLILPGFGHTHFLYTEETERDRGKQSGDHCLAQIKFRARAP